MLPSLLLSFNKVQCFWDLAKRLLSLEKPALAAEARIRTSEVVNVKCVPGIKVSGLRSLLYITLSKIVIFSGLDWSYLWNGQVLSPWYIC